MPPAFQYPEITCSRIVFMENQYRSLHFRETAWRLSSALVVREKRLGCVEIFYTEPVKELDEGPFLWEERLLLDDFTSRLAEAIEQQWARQDELLVAELGAKTEELEQFAHTVSHDLKTPLTTIGGFTRRMQVLLNRGEVSRASLQLERILEISDRMEQRLDDLLHLAKTGHIVKQAVTVSLKELILEAVTSLEEKLAQRGIEVEVASEFPLVLGDPGRLREVLENLMDNAIKYMGEQEAPRIEIGVLSSGVTPVFFVRDNGIGIAAEDLEKVFDLFVQLHPGGNYIGAGAGLAIAKRIIEALDGRIWAESGGQGQGASFCFTLPVAVE